MAFARYDVVATSAFEDDLDQATAYYLEASGPRSAERFLEEFDSFEELVGALPGHGSKVGDSGLRWRKIGVFVAVYAVDEEAHAVALLRLYYISSNWRNRILGKQA